jgi:hypothetical protein
MRRARKQRSARTRASLLNPQPQDLKLLLLYRIKRTLSTEDEICATEARNPGRYLHEVSNAVDESV